MFSLPENYTENNFLEDSLTLAERWRSLQNNDNLLEDCNFFYQYNCICSYAFLTLTSVLYTKDELTFVPFQFNENFLKDRDFSDLVEIKLETFEKFEKSFDLLIEIWGSKKRPGGQNLLSYPISFLRTSLEEQTSFLNTLETLDFEVLDLNLTIGLNTFNVELVRFFELLTIRENLVLIYQESSNFPFFQKILFQNILTLDKQFFEIFYEFFEFQNTLIKIRIDFEKMEKE